MLDTREALWVRLTLDCYARQGKIFLPAVGRLRVPAGGGAHGFGAER